MRSKSGDTSLIYSDPEQYYINLLVRVYADMVLNPNIFITDVFERFRKRDFSMQPGFVAVVGLAIHTNTPIEGVDQETIAAIAEILKWVLQDGPCCHSSTCEVSALSTAIIIYDALGENAM